MKSTRSFDRSPGSVAAARSFASELLRDANPEVLAVIKLMVSELATNCIRHTNSRFEVTIVATPCEIRVLATDLGTGEPVLRSPMPTDLSGRGLRIVDMLATDWGYELSGSGKTVWFALSTVSDLNQ
ncbi:MAG: ATP-binding protein [Solirubrobacteraceae bacterium]